MHEFVNALAILALGIGAIQSLRVAIFVASRDPEIWERNRAATKLAWANARRELMPEEFERFKNLCDQGVLVSSPVVRDGMWCEHLRLSDSALLGYR